MNQIRQIALLMTAGLAATNAAAANCVAIVTSVPVDSPWALAGLGTIIALITARALRNRNK